MAIMLLILVDSARIVSLSQIVFPPPANRSNLCPPNFNKILANINRYIGNGVDSVWPQIYESATNSVAIMPAKHAPLCVFCIN